jgi:hypothetical protein
MSPFKECSARQSYKDTMTDGRSLLLYPGEATKPVAAYAALFNISKQPLLIKGLNN